MPRVNDKHKEKRKLQILNAAYRCFSKKGYHSTSMRDIFKSAKLSSGAVYNYFKSKDEIVRELVILGLNSTKSLINQITSNSDNREALRQITQEYFKRMRHPDSVKGIRADVSIWTAALTDKKLMKLVQLSFEDKTFLFSSTIKSLQKKQKVKPKFTADATAQILISIIQGLTIQKMVNPQLNIKAYEKVAFSFLDQIYSNKPK